MKKKYKFVCLVNPSEGRDAEFNAWHSAVHLPQVIKEAGFDRGYRMKLVSDAGAGDARYQYLVILEGESVNPQDHLNRLFQAATDGRVEMSDTVGESWTSLYEEM